MQRWTNCVHIIQSEIVWITAGVICSQFRVQEVIKVRPLNRVVHIVVETHASHFSSYDLFEKKSKINANEIILYLRPTLGKRFFFTSVKSKRVALSVNVDEIDITCAELGSVVSTSVASHPFDAALGVAIDHFFLRPATSTVASGSIVGDDEIVVHHVAEQTIAGSRLLPCQGSKSLVRIVRIDQSQYTIF